VEENSGDGNQVQNVLQRNGNRGPQKNDNEPQTRRWDGIQEENDIKNIN
jgi:hypothetical protein